MCERFHMHNNHNKECVVCQRVLCPHKLKQEELMCMPTCNHKISATTLVLWPWLAPPKTHSSKYSVANIKAWYLTRQKQAKSLLDFKQEVTLKNTGIPVQRTQSKSWNSRYFYGKRCSWSIKVPEKYQGRRKAKQGCSSVELWNGSDVFFIL